MAFDQGAARQWLAVLHGDSPGLVHICSTGNWTGRTFPTNQLDQAAAYIAKLDAAAKEGIYTRVTTMKPDVVLEDGQRGGAADTLAFSALWADLDLAGPGHAETNLPPDEAAGRQVIAATGLPEPTLWIHSGGGLYPIWLLDQPHLVDHGEDGDLADIKDLAAGWQKVIRHAAEQLGYRYGSGVGDLARVLRIPGTINRKEGLERPCRIIAATPVRYPLAALFEALAAALAAIPTPTTPTPVTRERAGDGPAPGDDYNARADWKDILEPHGWTLSHYRDQTRYWTRPGKNHGISATTNALGTDRLHIFTTSTMFDADESYSKFGAYAILEHGGDHSAAARALANQGYGTPLPNPSDIQRQELRDLLGPGVDPDVEVRKNRAANPLKYFTFDSGRKELLVATLADDVLAQGPLAEGADNLVWSYRDGVWSADKYAVRNRLVDLLGEQYRNTHTSHVDAVVRSRADRIACDPIPSTINFRNGLYLWQADQLHPHDPAVPSTVQLAVNWDPTASCPEFDRFLAQVLPTDMIELAWELIGYLMYSGNPLHKAVMLSGGGRNGKGTLLRVVVALLGQRNISAISLHDLIHTRFATASLFGKIANIAGDIDGTYLESTALFKAITGQDVISAEHKGKDRFDFVPWAVPVFSANKIPGSADVTTGYLSRWLVIDFPHDFTGREDRGLTDRLTTKAELEGIAAKAIPALRRLMTRRDFDNPPSAQAAMRKFTRQVDHIRTWVDECTESDNDTWVSRTDLYAEYKAWASRDGYRPVKAGEFYNRLESIGVQPKKVNGNRGFGGLRVLEPLVWRAIP